MVKTAVKRREAAWEEVLEARDEVAKEGCREAYKEENRRLKDLYISEKKGSE